MIRCYCALLSMLLCLGLATLGCGPKEVRLEDKLVGAWQGRFQIDQAAVDQRLAAATDPTERLMLQAAVETMNDTNAAFDIDLKADGTFQSKYSSGDKAIESTGTWQLKDVAGSQATLVTAEKDTSHEHPLKLDADFLTSESGFSMPAPGPLAEIGSIRFQRR